MWSRPTEGKDQAEHSSSNGRLLSCYRRAYCASRRFIAGYHNANVVVDRFQRARRWFSTDNIVVVRKALEDDVQIVLSGSMPLDMAIARVPKIADKLIRRFIEQTALKLPE